MYPTFTSPVTALSLSTMLNDQAIADAEHRRTLAQARETRCAQSREAKRDGVSSTPRHRVRPAVAAVGLALVVALGISAAGSLPIGQHDAPTPRAVRYP